MWRGEGNVLNRVKVDLLFFLSFEITYYSVKIHIKGDDHTRKSSLTEILNHVKNWLSLKVVDRLPRYLMFPLIVSLLTTIPV